MTPNNLRDIFPLSKTNTIKGTRRLAREKVLQTLVTYDVSDVEWEKFFDYIFERIFNFGDEEAKFDKLLTPEEIIEIEADIPIEWKPEDKNFAYDLIMAVLTHRKEIDGYIIDVAENWKLERIAILDKILIEMAVAEMLHFENIPTKVSINEAIEIAKLYSTDKSGKFINGVLDNILSLLKKENKIKKSGRGLL